jgi:8-oxo-dGTP pyrophosphatase MutT (NUDIX family)/ketosteroid isomerase-like protein
MTSRSRRAFSVAVFARHDGKILLIEHARLKTWLPPGGEIHEGETPLEAARRELLEETGLVGSFTARSGVDGSPPGFLGYEEHDAGSKGLHMNISFVADIEGDALPAVRPNHEFTRYQWVSSLDAVDCPRNVRELAAIALAEGRSPLVALARRWMRAFNTRDLEGLLDLYSDDAVHTSPRLKARQPESLGKVAGKQQLRSWWRDSMDRTPRLHYREIHLTADRERVWMLYERTNPGDAPLQIAEVLCVRDGRIVESAVYNGS